MSPILRVCANILCAQNKFCVKWYKENSEGFMCVSLFSKMQCLISQLSENTVTPRPMRFSFVVYMPPAF